MAGKEEITICLPEATFRRIVRFSNQGVNSALAYYRRDKEWSPAQLAKKDKWESMLIKPDLICKHPKEKPGYVIVTLPRETLAYAFRAYNTPDSQKVMKDKYVPYDIDDFIVEKDEDKPKPPQRVLVPYKDESKSEVIEIFSPLENPSSSFDTPVLETPAATPDISPIPSGGLSISDILMEYNAPFLSGGVTIPPNNPAPQIYSPDARKITTKRLAKAPKPEVQPIGEEPIRHPQVTPAGFSKRERAKQDILRRTVIQVIPIGTK